MFLPPAHATTTHRGLGANTAIQDAVDFATALLDPDVPAALDRCEKTVVKRGAQVVRDSMQSTAMIHDATWFGAWGTPVIFRIIGFAMSFT
jgi:2-polyprenyl-6-methoxyphenol hydroxylase-like FAD-dependent oxidoreductase